MLLNAPYRRTMTCILAVKAYDISLRLIWQLGIANGAGQNIKTVIMFEFSFTDIMSPVQEVTILHVRLIRSP